jgi:hypothetical protein
LWRLSCFTKANQNYKIYKNWNLAYSNKENIKILCKIKKSKSYVHPDSKFKYVLNSILNWNTLVFMCITCYRTIIEMLFFLISNYIETMVLRLYFYNDLFKTESLYEFGYVQPRVTPHDLLMRKYSWYDYLITGKKRSKTKAKSIITPNLISAFLIYITCLNVLKSTNLYHSYKH